MSAHPLSRRFALVALTAGVLLLGCDRRVPVLRGVDQEIAIGGMADDGDDSNGPRQSYDGNPDRNATDGAARAETLQIDFRRISASVVAQPGAQATRLSASNSNNRVTSTFEVPDAMPLRFELDNSGSATLDSGVGGYLVAVRVLDGHGQYVPGTDFQMHISFAQNAAGSIDVSRDGQKFTEINHGGRTQRDDRGPANAFTLQPGTYTLLFEMNVDAQADGRADVRASSVVSLVEG